MATSDVQRLGTRGSKRVTDFDPSVVHTIDLTVEALAENSEGQHNTKGVKPRARGRAVELMDVCHDEYYSPFQSDSNTTRFHPQCG